MSHFLWYVRTESCYGVSERFRLIVLPNHPPLPFHSTLIRLFLADRKKQIASEFFDVSSFNASAQPFFPFFAFPFFLPIFLYRYYPRTTIFQVHVHVYVRNTRNHNADSSTSVTNIRSNVVSNGVVVFPLEYAHQTIRSTSNDL